MTAVETAPEVVEALYVSTYDKAMLTLGNTAGRKYHAWYMSLEADPLQGWLAWFELQHPILFKKYEAALERIDALWGSKEPKALLAFKEAVQVEVKATQWAVDRFLELRNSEERLRGRQEEMAI